MRLLFLLVAPALALAPSPARAPRARALRSVRDDAVPDDEALARRGRERDEAMAAWTAELRELRDEMREAAAAEAEAVEAAASEAATAAAAGQLIRRPSETISVVSETQGGALVIEVGDDARPDATAVAQGVYASTMGIVTLAMTVGDVMGGDILNLPFSVLGLVCGACCISLAPSLRALPLSRVESLTRSIRRHTPRRAQPLRSRAARSGSLRAPSFASTTTRGRCAWARSATAPPP